MKMIHLFLSALVLALSASAQASLELYKTPGPDLSNTIQAQTYILQLGDSPSESGCVAWIGGATVSGAAACGFGPALPAFSGGDEKPSTTTRTAGESGIDSGADLRIVFDANQQGAGANTGDPIDIDALRLLVFNPTTGALIYSTDLKTPDCQAVENPTNVFPPCHIDPTVTGNGKNDALFRLDAASAAAFDAAVALSGVTLANVRIGLLANISGPSNGGFEGFYLGDIAKFDPPVPEPGTLAIVALGLACTMFARRRLGPARIPASVA